MTYSNAAKVLDFTADAGASHNVAVSTLAANQIRILVDSLDAITLAGDAVANANFVLSTTNTANDTLTINTAPASSPLAALNINLADQDDTLTFGLAEATNGVGDMTSTAGRATTS